MKMIPFWGKARASPQNLEQVAQALNLIITSTVAAFEDAQRNNEVAIKNLEMIITSTVDAFEATRKSTEVALARLKELEEADNEMTAGRVARLVIFCMACIFLAAFFTFNGTKAFAKPLPLVELYNSVVIAVKVPQPLSSAHQRSIAPMNTYINETISQGGKNFAEYQIYAPARYAGKKYVLMLEGHAQIDEPTRMLSEPPLRHRFATCRYPHPKGQPSAIGSCELITGQFPAEADDFMPGQRSCLAGLAGSAISWNGGGNAVTIDIGGQSHIASASDWANHLYVLPSFMGSSDDYLNKLNGVSLSGWYRTGNPDGCLRDFLPVHDELSDMYPRASQSLDGQLLWDSGAVLTGPAIVTRQRDAEEIGNGLLALGAATAALAIGFIPVAYDANRSRRRALRRRKSP